MVTHSFRELRKFGDFVLGGALDIVTPSSRHGLSFVVSIYRLRTIEVSSNLTYIVQEQSVGKYAYSGAQDTCLRGSIEARICMHRLFNTKYFNFFTNFVLL